MLIFYGTKCTLNHILSVKNIISIAYTRNSKFTTSLVNFDKKLKDKSENVSEENQKNQSAKDPELLKQKSSKIEKLKKFSFIQFDDLSNSKKFVLNTHKVNLIPEKKQHLDLEKKNEIKKEELKESQESAAVKLAKLIDKEEPVKTAEKLLEPIKKLNKNLKKSSNQTVNIKQKIESKRNEDVTNNTEKKQIQELKKQTKNRKKENLVLELPNIVEDSNKIDSNQKLELKDLNMITVKTTPKDVYSEMHHLKSGNGLFLFNKENFHPDINITKESPIWTMHYNDELKQAQEIPPINGFDEMIQLTNEGKLWKFPIDNEQDIDELDAQIPFHEHVFLDNYLEEFPQIEPIQQFMTLALNGISQNSFLSLNEKKEIINWYKNYFNDKLDVIKEALEAEKLEVSFRGSVNQE